LEGDNVTITCTASGVPLPTLSIYNSTSLLQQGMTGVVELVGVTNHDDGIYRCEPSNIVGGGPIAHKTLSIYGEY